MKYMVVSEFSGTYYDSFETEEKAEKWAEKYERQIKSSPGNQNISLTLRVVPDTYEYVWDYRKNCYTWK